MQTLSERNWQEVSDRYDEDYFERGIQTGKSNYENYRWLEELSCSLAEAVIRYANLKIGEYVLDFGCAKGFMVRAFRLYGMKSWGMDVSEYAIECAERNHWGNYCELYRGQEIRGEQFNLIYCKDVLEHLEYEELDIILKEFAKAQQCWIVVPFGYQVSNVHFAGYLRSTKKTLYIEESANQDRTHVICQPETWWLKKFKEFFYVKMFAHRLPDIRDIRKSEEGAGIFLLERKE